MLVPWRKVKRWRCIRCGVCCYKYQVPVSLSEALRISRAYGDVVTLSKGGRYILRRIKGRCIFLSGVPPFTSCLIHLEKPICCRLWPFHFYVEPKYGLSGDDAVYIHGDRKLFVYINDECSGLGRGMEIEALLSRAAELWVAYKGELKAESTAPSTRLSFSFNRRLSRWEFLKGVKAWPKGLFE
jgi:Fe-S-cluster containining protein